MNVLSSSKRPLLHGGGCLLAGWQIQQGSQSSSRQPSVCLSAQLTAERNTNPASIVHLVGGDINSKGFAPSPQSKAASIGKHEAERLANWLGGILRRLRQTKSFQQAC